MDLRMRLATSSRLPASCKNRIGGSKARILNKEAQKMEKTLHVTHLLKHMRVTQGILMDRLDLDEVKWNKAWKNYGPIVLSTSEDEED